MLSWWVRRTVCAGEIDGSVGMASGENHVWTEDR